MELRIKGNSIRLRVSTKDLARLMRQGAIVEFTQFSPNPSHILSYSLALSNRREPNVTLDGGDINITIPSEQAYRWADSDEPRMEAHKLIDHRFKLFLLIEKDFECLDRLDDENVDELALPNN